MSADVARQSALHREVAAVAADLGLAGSGPGSRGFDDRDFRPKAHEQGKATADNGIRNPGKKKERKHEKDRAVDRNSTKGGKSTRRNVGDAPRKKTSEPVEWERPPRVTVDAHARRLAERVAGCWHHAAEEFGPLPGTKSKKGVPAAAPKLPTAGIVVQLRDKAEKILAQVAAATAAASKDSDATWMRAAQRSGTTADRVAAHALLIRSSACGNLRSLDALAAMVSRGHARVIGDALDALTALFTSELLPDRKLAYFHEQPLDQVDVGTEDGEVRLLLWYVEDAIKKKYGQFVVDLEEKGKHALQFVREKVVKTCFELLVRKPEQEQLLLSILVNKYGDKERKVRKILWRMLGG